MKPLYIIFFSLLSFTSVYSQSSQSIQEPEYSGNFILVKDSLNATPLEKQKAINKAKAGASLYIIGVGKVTGSNIIKGQKSPIRTQQKKDLKFIVKVKDNSIDPFTQINIFSISKNPNKDERFLEVGNVGTFSGSTSMDIAFIPFESKKYGVSSYLIQIPQELAPGEYALTIDGSRDVFNMFGID